MSDRDRIAYILNVCARALPQERRDRIVMGLAKAKEATPAIDLERLANADDMTISHDVAGILRNLNLKTMTYDNEFRPRCTS